MLCVHERGRGGQWDEYKFNSEGCETELCIQIYNNYIRNGISYVHVLSCVGGRLRA